MYGPDGEGRYAKLARLDQAKALCSRCPVRQVCLDHALAVDEPFGVWGGLDASERRTTRSAPTGSQKRPANESHTVSTEANAA